MPAHILRRTDLGFSDKNVLSLIAKLSKGKVGCRVSHRYLAEQLGTKRGTIRNIVSGLRAKGFLEKDDTDGGRHCDLRELRLTDRLTPPPHHEFVTPPSRNREPPITNSGSYSSNTITDSNNPEGEKAFSLTDDQKARIVALAEARGSGLLSSGLSGLLDRLLEERTASGSAASVENWVALLDAAARSTGKKPRPSKAFRAPIATESQYGMRHQPAVATNNETGIF